MKLMRLSINGYVKLRNIKIFITNHLRIEHNYTYENN